MNKFKKNNKVTVLDPIIIDIDLDNLLESWVDGMDNSIDKSFIIEDFSKKSDDCYYYYLSNGWMYHENLLVLCSDNHFSVGDDVQIQRVAKKAETTRYIWIHAMTDKVGLISKVTEVVPNYSKLRIDHCWYHNNTLELVNPNDKLITFVNSNPIETDNNNIQISFPCK